MAPQLQISLSLHEFDGQNPPSAYAYAETLAGASRVLLLTSSFLATGKVRVRSIGINQARVEIKEIRKGSLIFVITVSLLGAATFAAGASRYGGDLDKIFKYVFRRDAGLSSKSDADDAKACIQKEFWPALDAQLEKNRPALIQLHEFSKSGGRTDIRSSNTAYLQPTMQTLGTIKGETIERKMHRFPVAVTSLNANTDHCRVLVEGIGRTVPMELDDDDNYDLTRSLDQYKRAHRSKVTPPFIYIAGRAVRGKGGYLKRIIKHPTPTDLMNLTVFKE